MTRTRAYNAPQRQTRSLAMTDFEFRDASDGITLEGYASTFEQPYSMGWYTETIRSGAFSKTLAEKPDVRLLINHDGLPLARTKSGTLLLSQDTRGLHFSASLDPNDPDVASLRPKMERGDVDECSFGFDVVKQEWSSDRSQRSMVELSLSNGDVSVVTYPANAGAVAKMRSLRQAAIANPEKVRTLYKELREGKMLSQANVDILTAVLESLSIMDSHIDQVDIDLDAAQAELSDLLGVVDPDPADDETPDIPDLEAVDGPPNTLDDPANARSLPLSVYKAKAQAIALRSRAA